MGVRIKIIVILLFFVVSCKVFFTNDKRKDILDLKNIAFCTCINQNYAQIDSTFFIRFKDVSGSSVFQGSNLSAEIEQAITQYSKDKTSNFYQLKNHTTSEVSDSANYIMLACLDFYNSVELENFILQTLKKHKKRISN